MSTIFPAAYQVVLREEGARQLPAFEEPTFYQERQTQHRALPVVSRRGRGGRARPEDSPREPH